MAVINPQTVNQTLSFSVSDIQTLAEAVRANAEQLDRLFGNTAGVLTTSTLEQETRVDSTITFPLSAMVSAGGGISYNPAFGSTPEHDTIRDNILTWLGIDPTTVISTFTEFTTLVDLRYDISGTLVAGTSGLLLVNQLLPAGSIIRYTDGQIQIPDHPLPTIHPFTIPETGTSSIIISDISWILLGTSVTNVEVPLNLGDLNWRAGTGITLGHDAVTNSIIISLT